MGLQKNYSPDVGFHLQSAQWMVDNKTIIKQDFFTYTSMGRNYFDMQWLYQFVLFFFNKFGGDKLLVVVNAILISTAVFIVWLRYKQEIGSKFNTALFVIVLLIAIQPLSFEIRPHVFSWIYLSVLLLILSNYKAGKTKQLVFIPLVMLLWVNSHSLSVLGLVVISIYVVGDYLERKKADKTLLKFGGVSLLVFLINPYFTDGLLFPLEQFNILKGQAYQKLYIGELQTPFTFAEYKKEGWAYIFSPLLYMQVYSLAALWVGMRSLIKKKLQVHF
ncbi:MAG: hypothetical protein IPJ32_18345 [Sphingobacteriaceae bacterium]|nr:hypothetical protein [Sphingobacteriaceae bacterium]